MELLAAIDYNYHVLHIGWKSQTYFLHYFVSLLWNDIVEMPQNLPN